MAQGFYGGLMNKSGTDLLTVMVVLFFIGVFNALQYNPTECWSLELVFTHCTLKLKHVLKGYLTDIKLQFVFH